MIPYIMNPAKISNTAMQYRFHMISTQNLPYTGLKYERNILTSQV